MSPKLLKQLEKCRKTRHFSSGFVIPQSGIMGVSMNWQEHIESMENEFKELLSKVSEITKPPGYKKEASNFRLFAPDGLCKIINFQKNKWNTKEHLEFVINAGIYFEKNTAIENRKFKEYECQIRKRFDRRIDGEKSRQRVLDTMLPAGILFQSGSREIWWCIDRNTDADVLFESVRNALGHIFEWFNIFTDKETVIEMMLNGKAKQYTDVNVMAYGNAKLLVDMGYGERVYPLIKDGENKAEIWRELIKQINSMV